MNPDSGLTGWMEWARYGLMEVVWPVDRKDGDVDERWEQAGWSYDTLLDAQWMEDERAVVDGSWPTGRTTLFGKNSG